MKLKIILALIVPVSTFSCKKDANSGAIIGKWRTTEILYTANMSGPLYVQFIWPGRVQSTFFSNCTGYGISGHNLTLKFNGAAYLTQITYIYPIKQDTLILSQDNCADDCTMTFVKE